MVLSWSDEQRAIFACPDAHIVVRARAGAGKTTTAVEMVNDPDRQESTLMTAFNKSIAATLQQRVRKGVDVCTMHSLGLTTLRRAWGPVRVDPYKGAKIAQAVAEDLKVDAEYDFPYMLMVLAGLVKNSGARTLDDVYAVVMRHMRADALAHAPQVTRAVVACVKKASEDHTSVDYDDMVYFPVKYGLTPPPYGTVVVDELQDMNPVQLALVLRAAGHRIVAIGDEKQAIYRWRGAGATTMRDVIEELDATVLPLSTTYRCSRAVVDYVKTEHPDVSDLKASENADDGWVTDVLKDEFDPQPGDFVLSRLNAPLIEAAIQLAVWGQKVKVVGTDVPKGVIALLRRAPDDLRAVPRWCDKSYEEVHEDLVAANRKDDLRQVKDEYRTLKALVRHASTKAEVRTRVLHLFGAPSAESVCFSTAHKAKGQERDRVWLLADTFRREMHDPAQNEEEANVHYVAATRARRDLHLVYGEYEP